MTITLLRPLYLLSSFGNIVYLQKGERYDLEYKHDDIYHIKVGKEIVPVCKDTLNHDMFKVEE